MKNGKLEKGDYVILPYQTKNTQKMYEVDWCAISLILKDAKGEKFSARQSDAKYVPPEEAMLWILENQK